MNIFHYSLVGLRNVVNFWTSRYKKTTSQGVRVESYCQNVIHWYEKGQNAGNPAKFASMIAHLKLLVKM